MIRLVVAMIALALMVPPSLSTAADRGRYENARFGYVIDVPPGFVGQGEADNGDGQVFRAASGTQVLTVFGGNVTEADFEHEVAWRKAADTALRISYEASAPSWASWSGKRGNRILYARAIALCGGRQFAMFELEYFAVDLAEMDPVVSGLVRSFKATGSGAGC